MARGAVVVGDVYFFKEALLLLPVVFVSKCWSVERWLPVVEVVTNEPLDVTVKFIITLRLAGVEVMGWSSPADFLCAGCRFSLRTCGATPTSKGTTITPKPPLRSRLIITLR